MTSSSSLKNLLRHSWRRIVGSLALVMLATACGGGVSESGTDRATGGDTTAGAHTRAKAEAWGYCAAYGETCNFVGTREIRFGTLTTFTVKVLSNGTACTTGVFGDPAPGQHKYCWYNTDTTTSSTATAATVAQPTAVATTTGWTYCTYQGGYCSFSGTRTVRYGTASASITKTLSNGAQCTDAVFGDPAYGVPKACWLGTTTTTSTTSTVTATAPTTASVAPTYGVTQAYPMGNYNAWGMAGQLTTLRVRFNAVPLGQAVKLYFHLYRMDGTYQASIGHHLRYIDSTNWRGQVQYDHPAYIPTSIPAGTYRVGVGYYQAYSPYNLMLSQLTGSSGVGMMTSQYNSGYNIGTLTVASPTQGDIGDQRYGPFLALQASGW